MHEVKTQFSKLDKFELPEAPERDFSRLDGLISGVSDEVWAAMNREILSMWKYSESLADYWVLDATT